MPSSTSTSYTSTITQFVDETQSTLTVISTLTSYTAAPNPSAPPIPAPLSKYKTTDVRKACSTAVPTPITRTSYKTAYSGIATALTDYTTTSILAATDPAEVATATIYETVFAPQRSSVIYLAGDSSLEDRTAANGGNSTGWGSFLSGFPLLTSEFLLNFGSGGATTQSYLDGHRNKWPALLKQLRDGATVVLETGINDSHKNITEDTGIYSRPMKQMIGIIKSKVGFRLGCAFLTSSGRSSRMSPSLSLRPSRCRPSTGPSKTESTI
jgi:hypothetical protein